MKSVFIAGVIITLLALAGNSLYNSLLSSPSVNRAEQSLQYIGNVYGNVEAVSVSGNLPSTTEANNLSKLNPISAVISLFHVGLMLNIGVFLLLLASPLVLFGRYLRN